LLLSAIISLIVIAVSWVFVRPLLGISLLVIAFGIIFLVIKLLRKNSDPATQTA
jgi:Flp pilus assembly protein TadB